MIITNKLIEDGYISRHKHPEFDYYIYNYTAKTQYDGVWNSITLACRGLILDGEGNVIARPFSKFFNYGEYGKNTNLGELPEYESFDVYDKLDGSLGILYTRPDGKLAIATRGSFESEQSQVANKILKEKYSDLKVNPDFTYLFEIIYPENRIVVDYGEQEDLILLAIVETKTGIDLPRTFVEQVGKMWRFPVVRKYHFYVDVERLFEVLQSSNNNTEEGVVVHTDTGFRFKMKYEEYVRLHRLITGVNEKAIWEILKEGQSLDNLLDRTPDEFNKWVKNTKDKLEEKYKSIEHSCQTIINNTPKEIVHGKIRKLVAEYFLSEPNKIYSGVLFSMFDFKDYSKIIWKLIKPAKIEPFKVEK